MEGWAHLLEIGGGEFAEEALFGEHEAGFTEAGLMEAGDRDGCAGAKRPAADELGGEEHRSGAPEGAVAPSSQKRQQRNNARNRQRVAQVKETATLLRVELERQGALAPVPEDIVAAGGRALDMACPKTKVLEAALRRLTELREENERLRRTGQPAAQDSSPWPAVMPPPGSAPGSLVVNFATWAFQHSSVPTCIILGGDTGGMRMVTCNRAFVALLGLDLISSEIDEPRTASGAPVTWNDLVHSDHHMPERVAAGFANALRDERLQQFQKFCRFRRVRPRPRRDELEDDGGSDVSTPEEPAVSYVPCRLNMKPAQVDGAGNVTAVQSCLVPCEEDWRPTVSKEVADILARAAAAVHSAESHLQVAAEEKITQHECMARAGMC